MGKACLNVWVKDTRLHKIGVWQRIRAGVFKKKNARGLIGIVFFPGVAISNKISGNQFYTNCTHMLASAVCCHMI